MFFQRKSPLLKALRARHRKAPDPGEPGAVKKGDWKTFHMKKKAHCDGQLLLYIFAAYCQPHNRFFSPPSI